MFKISYKELGDNAVLLCYEKYADIEQGKTFRRKESTKTREKQKF